MKKASNFKTLTGSSKVTGIEGKIEIRNSHLPLWESVANTMISRKKTMVGGLCRDKVVANSAKSCGIRGNDDRHQTVLTICRNLSHFGILQQTNPRLPMFKVNDFEALSQLSTEVTEIMAMLVETPVKVRKKPACGKCGKSGHKSATCVRAKVHAIKVVNPIETKKKIRRAVHCSNCGNRGHDKRQCNVIIGQDFGGWMLESGVDISKLAELLALVEKCGGFKHLEEILTDDMFTPCKEFVHLTATELASGELDNDSEDLESQWDALSAEFGDSIVTTL